MNKYEQNDNEPIERTLTVINYGEDEHGELLKTRVTLARDMIQFLISSDSPHCKVDGTDLYKINVVLSGGNNLELFVTFLDLQMIERAVGVYYLS